MYHINLQRLLLLISLSYFTVRGQNWPTLLFNAGETIFIPCIPQGNEASFFWRKGEWFNISEQIAYNIDGTSYPPSEKYKVFLNGTLAITNTSLGDEGRYFCRLAATTTECSAAITVYLRERSFPYIEQCKPQPSCTLFQEPSRKVWLTCTALLVTPQMSLQWYRGSTEITDKIHVTYGKTSSNETLISSEIKIQYEGATSLTCQADGIKLDRTFAHVQLETKQAQQQQKPTALIVVLVLATVFGFIVTGILVYIICTKGIFVKKTRHEYHVTKTSTGDEERTHMMQEQEQDAEKREQKKDAETKENQLKMGLQEMEKIKNETIATLKESLQEKETKKNDEISALQEELKRKETSFTKQMSDLKAEHKAKGEEFVNQTLNLKTQLEDKENVLKKEILALTEQLGEKNSTSVKQFLDLKAEYEKKEKGFLKTIDDLRRTEKTKNEEVTSLQTQLKEKEDDLTKAKSWLERREREFKETIDKLKSQHKEKEEKLNNTNTDMQESIAEKEKIITDLTQQVNQNKKELVDQKIILQEIKWAWKEHEVLQRKLRTDVLDVKDNCMTLCRIKTGSRNTDARRKGENTINIFGNNFNYNSVLSLNASRKEVFLRLDDLIQNGIDGGNAMIFLHGNSDENISLMFDMQNEGGIIPKAIRKMFKESTVLKDVGLHFDITGVYAHMFSDDQTKLLFSHEEAKHESVEEGRVEIPTEEKALTFLNMHIKDKKFTNNFVQFFVKTSYEKKELTSGRLTFCSFNDIETMKNCLSQVKDESSAFVRFLTSVLRAEANLAILSNINEDDKDSAKVHLKFSQWINKEKEENHLFTRLRKRLTLKAR